MPNVHSHFKLTTPIFIIRSIRFCNFFSKWPKVSLNQMSQTSSKREGVISFFFQNIHVFRFTCIGSTSGAAIASAAKATTDKKPNDIATPKSFGQSWHSDAHIDSSWQSSNDATKRKCQFECRRHIDAVNAWLRYAYTTNAKTFGNATGTGTIARRAGRSRRARTICQNIQAATHQIGFHTG